MFERMEVARLSGAFFAGETPQISHSQIALCPLFRVPLLCIVLGYCGHCQLSSRKRI